MLTSSIILAAGTLPRVYAYDILYLTVTTDEASYYPLSGTSVHIYGNLTRNETRVTDGLVAIYVKDPGNNPYAIRTVNTGSNPPQTPYVRVESIFPCDSDGNIQYTFKQGTLANFKLTVINYDIFESREALLTVNTYDPDDMPFCSGSLKITLAPDSTSVFIVGIPIPSDATTGIATAYGNAYTDWPSLGGTPHCIEKSTQYVIEAKTLSYQSSIPFQTNENYNTTFHIKPKTRAGTYNVYVTANYEGQIATNSTTFKVGMLGDFDQDNDIDSVDRIYMARAYRTYWQTGEIIDPRCDFDEDNDIDYADRITMGRLYRDYWYP
jgi:hypothetical protein